MAMSVVYTNFCGMLVSETRNGVEADYVPDTLGSTAALVDNTQTITVRWEYWPYGEVSKRTGASLTRFTFVGMLGYAKDILDKLSYVRARHFRVDLARWLTVDSLWPKERSYDYAKQAPVLDLDPSGLNSCDLKGRPCSDYLKDALDGASKKLLDCLLKATTKEDIQKCLQSGGKDLSKKGAEGLRKYIACMVASGLARGNGIGLCDGCDPCKSGLEPPDSQWCCYEKFLSCLMACYGKGGIDFGLCIAKCQYVKDGFIDCGFADAL
jgi:RHS repeat-associated protein